MDLTLDYSLGEQYKNKAQKMRVITEAWVTRNSYCPICGCDRITHYEANRPVADFYCSCCKAEFELKSKDVISQKLPAKIPDGAYDTMISRITSVRNPHFLVLIHHSDRICHFLLIPKFFVVPHYIEKRKPLATTARRSGWIGCNIDLSYIPKNGIISMVRNERQEDKKSVLEQVAKAMEINEKSVEQRGWQLDVLKCIEAIPGKSFSLKDIYSYSGHLQNLHQENHCIEPKIRQQLQLLRNKGFIEFLGNGQYEKRG